MALRFLLLVLVLVPVLVSVLLLAVSVVASAGCGSVFPPSALSCQMRRGWVHFLARPREEG
jgi:hypothetical protein